jgi:hypothetical protein
MTLVVSFGQWFPACLGLKTPESLMYFYAVIFVNSKNLDDKREEIICTHF